jgi:hypothetical protein
LDFTPPPSEGRAFADDTPVIVVMHGLTGGEIISPTFYPSYSHDFQVPTKPMFVPFWHLQSHRSRKAGLDIVQSSLTSADVSACPQAMYMHQLI